MTEPRTLHFAEVQEAVAEAERLLEAGYECRGQWGLAQACGHLADWLRFPVEGFPKTGRAMGALLWVARHTSGPTQLRRILEKDEMPTGLPTLRATVPPPGGDDAAAVARLRDAVAAFRGHAGPYHPSPVFGPLDRDQWHRLQCVHCAHHLGYLEPKPPASA